MADVLGAFAADAFRSFRTPNYRLWFIGQGISRVGFFVQIVAVALLVLEMTNSGTVLGRVMALYFLPILLVGPWAGVLSDRVDKRFLLFVAQAAMMVCALALGVLVLGGWVTLPWVVLLAGLTGTAFAFDQPARRTIVTELVDDDAAANAVSLNGALSQGARIVGPAVAGGLVSTIGIGWCFLFNGLTYVAVLVALARMDGGAIRRPLPLPRARGQIAAGFAHAWADRSTRLILGMLAVVATLSVNWNVLLPLLAIRELGGTGGTFALLMAIMAVGSLPGILWLARRRTVAVDLLARVCIVFGLGSVALALAPSVLVAALVVPVVGATNMVLFNGGVVALQLGTVSAIRGRVMAVYGMVVVGGHAVGGPVSGWLAEQAGTRAALAVGAAAALVAGLAVRTALRGPTVVEAGDEV